MSIFPFEAGQADGFFAEIIPPVDRFRSPQNQDERDWAGFRASVLGGKSPARPVRIYKIVSKGNGAAPENQPIRIQLNGKSRRTTGNIVILQAAIKRKSLCGFFCPALQAHSRTGGGFR